MSLGREFPRRPSEYVYVQREHPKQRGNDITGAAYCASASLQRSEEIPVASEGRSKKGAAPGRKDGKNRRGGRDNEAMRKG